MLLLLILQTFVNDVRIQEQMYITLKLEDKLRFGYDILSLPAPRSNCAALRGLPAGGFKG